MIVQERYEYFIRADSMRQKKPKNASCLSNPYLCLLGKI